MTSNFDRAHYLATIQRAIDYIHAGDCFQVNVAQRLQTPAMIRFGEMTEDDFQAAKADLLARLTID